MGAQGAEGNECKMRNIRLGLAMAVVASLVAALNTAAGGSIVPPPDPDTNTALSDQVIIGNQVFNFPEGTNFSQFAPAFFPAPGLPNGAVILFENATETNISDQIWVQQGFFYFASDPDLQNLDQLGIPVVGQLVENGQPQDVSGAWGLPPGSVQVQSDVIPEPSSFLLVSIGLLGMQLLAWRRRRTMD
jgi:hypothetical protein